MAAKGTDWNVTAAWGKAGFDTGNAITSTYGEYAVNRITAGMNAESYRAQARMRLLEANRETGYINEKYSHDVWNTGDLAFSARGASNAYKGASGLDIAPGDIREERAIEYGANRQAAGINRTAYNQSFETQLQAQLEATRLEYAAKAQDAIKKYNSSGRAFTASLFAGLGAFAGNVGTLGSAGAFGKTNAANVATPTRSA